METHSRNRVFGGGDPPNKQKNDGLKKWASSTVWSTSTEGDRNNENSSKSTSTWDAKSVAGSEKSWTNTDDGWSVRGDANANKQQPPQPKQPTLAELMSAKKTGGVATATTRQATGGFGQQRQSRAREPPLNHLLGSFASNNSSRSFLARLDTVVGGGRQRSKSHGRSQSGGRSQSRGRNGSHGRSKSRGRREKYMPPKREEVDLFGESRLVQQGEIFEQVNKSLEETIIVLNSYGENLRIRKLEQFEQANFSSELMLNLQLTKFRTPTPIQKVVIPVLLGKRRCDLIAHAPTGCGKTGAFLLPIVRELQALVAKRQRTFNPDQPYALIVVPTKELAQQLYDDTRAFALRTGVSVCYTHGDMPMKQSLAELGAGCDIFISTCGRLGQFIEETYITLEELRYLVLDEADKLLKIPSFLNCIKMVKRHNTINPAHRTLMFSATYAPEISHMVMDFLRDGNFIQVMCGDGFGSAVDTVEQTFFMVERPDKQDKLIEILLNHDKTEMKQMLGGENYRKVPKTIVFVEEKRHSYKMTMALIGNSIRAVSLNADLSLKMRHEAVGKFATDECDVLVATNLGARGLNFPLVRLVINYDLPQYMNAEREYIHQIGRTGRIGNVGNAISFFDPESVNDCRNAAYYIKVLEDSHSDVPDWLRKVAAEYAQPEGAKKAEEPEAPAREQQQENEETKTESTEKGTTICSSSEEEEETTSEEEAEEAASRASTLKSKRSGDTWLTASNKNVYLGKKKIVGQGKKKQNKWAVTSSEEEEETTNEERED